MKTTTKRILAGGISIGGLLLLLLAWFFFSRFWIGRYPIIEGHGMMRDGFSHFSSALGAFFGWLVLAAVIFFLIVVGIWLARRKSQKQEGVPAEQNPDEPPICPSCGEDIQADWNLCPYCGHDLS